MANTPPEKRLDTHGAHSRFRKGETDYGDGGHLTHYLGNDDYTGNEERDRLSREESEVDGSEAHGNDLTEEDLRADEEEGQDEASPKSDTLYDASI